MRSWEGVLSRAEGAVLGEGAAVQGGGAVHLLSFYFSVKPTCNLDN